MLDGVSGVLIVGESDGEIDKGRGRILGLRRSDEDATLSRVGEFSTT